MSCQQQEPHQSKLNNISESLIDNARLWSDSYLMKTETKRENRKRPKPKASGRKQLGRLGKCKFLPGRLMGDRFPTEGLKFHKIQKYKNTKIQNSEIQSIRYKYWKACWQLITNSKFNISTTFGTYAASIPYP